MTTSGQSNTRRSFRAGLAMGALIGAATTGALYRRQLASMMAGVRGHDRVRCPVEHPVLIINRCSGGGKAERWGLARVAADLGIEPAVFTRGEQRWVLSGPAHAAGPGSHEWGRDGCRRQKPRSRESTKNPPLVPSV